jgi:hypothetical protein
MNRGLAYRNRFIVDIDAIDAKSRPAVAQPHAGYQLAKARDCPLKRMRDSPGTDCPSALAAVSAIARTGPAMSE